MNVELNKLLLEQHVLIMQGYKFDWLKVTHSAIAARNVADVELDSTSDA